MKTSAPNPIVRIFLVALLALLGIGTATAANITVTTSQNWSALTGGSGPGGLPNTSDTVEVRSGATVTVDVSDAACGGITLGGTATSSGAGTLLFNSGSQLTVSGTVQIGGGGTGRTGSINMTSGGKLIASALAFVNTTGNTWTPGSGTVELAANNTLPSGSGNPFTSFNNLTISSGTTSISINPTPVNGNLVVSSGAGLTVGTGISVAGTTTVGGTLTISSTTGTKTFTGDVTINSGGLWNETANANIGFGGSLQNDGTLTAGTGTHTFTGALKTFSGTVSIPNLTISGTGSAYQNNGTLTVSGTLTVTSPGVLTNNGTITATTALSGTGALIQTAGSTLNLGGATTDAAGVTTLNATANANTVNYTRSGNQTVKATTYHHMNFSGAGTKTTGGTTTINGDLSVAGGSAFTVAAHTISVAGTTTVNGTLTHSSTTGTKTYSGDVTINAGGAWTESANATISFGGSLLNDGTFTSGTGVHTFSGAAQTFSGASPIPIPNTTITGSYQNNGMLTVGTALAGAGSLTQGTDATLNLGGTATISTLDVTASGNTVNYSGAAQTVLPFAYVNLTLSGSNTKSVTANLDVSGTLTVSTGVTLSPSAGVALNSGGAQGTLTGAGTIQVTITPGALADQYKFATYTLSGLTADYAGLGPQTVNSTATVGSYGALTTSGASGTRTRTLGGDVTVNGNVTIGSGTTLDASGSNHALTVGGNWANTGTFTPQAGIVTLNGGGAQSIAATTFSHLTLGGTSAAATTGAVTMTGNLTVPAGTSLTVGGNFTFSVAGTTTVGGSLALNGTAAKTFTGDVTIEDDGTWTEGTGAVSFAGSLQNDGSLSANSGTHTFSGASKTLGGASPIAIATVTVTGTYANSGTLTMSSTLTVTSPGVLTNNGTITTSALSGTGSLIQGADAALNIGGTSGITSLDATASGNTVNYTGANQTTKVTSYHHLTLAGSGTKTLNAGITTVNGNFTIGGTATSTLLATLNVGGDLTVSGGTLNLSTFTANRTAAGGTLTLGAGATLQVAGTGTLPANYSTHAIDAASTVHYSGTTQLVAALNSGQNYGNLTISGTQTKTLAGSVGIAGDLTVSGSTLDLDIHSANRATSGGTLTLASGTTLKIGGTGTLPGNFAVRTINATSTIEYSGTAQTVAAEAYGNLTLSGSDTKTLVAGTTSIAGVLTIGSGTTFDAGNNDFSITGAWVNNGTFTASGTQTVTYTGAGNQSLGGSTATAFNKLTVAKSTGTLTASTDFSVASVLTIQSAFSISSRTVTLSGPGTPLVHSGGTFTVTSSTIRYTSATGANVVGTTYNNLTLDSPGQTFTAAGPMTNSSTLTIAADTIFDGADKTVTLPGTGTPFVVDGMFEPSTSTIRYTSIATAAANVTGAGYYNLLVNGNGSGDTFTVIGNISVGGDLTVGTGNTATLNANGNAITVAGLTTVNGTYQASTGTQSLTGGLTLSGTAFTGSSGTVNVGDVTLTSGSLTAPNASGAFNVAGNWTRNSGTFTPNGGTVTFNGTTVQTIGGSQVTAFNQLVSANAAGANVSRNMVVAGGTVNSGALLSGVGPIGGTVTVNGTLAIGTNGIGTLTLTNTPALNGTVLARINHTNTQRADLLTLTAGTLTYDGTLTVNNLGPAPTNGSVFQLFNAPAYAGVFSSITLPPGDTTHWKTDNLTVDGTLIFTNNNPVARAITTTVAQGGVATIPFDLVKYKLATDADNDSLTIATATGASHGNLGIAPNGLSISYTNTSGAGGTVDTFTFTVADGFGGTATNTVTVTITDAQGFNLLSATPTSITYLGIIGAQYALENTAILTPATWVPVVTNTAGTDGKIIFNLNPPSGYYRTRYVSGP